VDLRVLRWRDVDGGGGSATELRATADGSVRLVGSGLVGTITWRVHDLAALAWRLPHWGSIVRERGINHTNRTFAVRSRIPLALVVSDLEVVLTRWGRQQHQPRANVPAGAWAGARAIPATVLPGVSFEVRVTRDLPDRVTSVLRGAGIPVYAPRSVNGSQNNFSVIVPETRRKEAVDLLHRAFVVVVDGSKRDGAHPPGAECILA
jgi:hypothetical protein